MGQKLAFCIGFISVSKLFPVKFQSTVYSIVNFMAHLVACAGPLIAEIPNPVPYLTFVIAMIVSTVALSFLKELEPQNENTQIKNSEAYQEVQETSRT